MNAATLITSNGHIDGVTTFVRYGELLWLETDSGNCLVDPDTIMNCYDANGQRVTGDFWELWERHGDRYV